MGTPSLTCADALEIVVSYQLSVKAEKRLFRFRSLAEEDGYWKLFHDTTLLKPTVDSTKG
jgi:hypothetical protein